MQYFIISEKQNIHNELLSEFQSNYEYFYKQQVVLEFNKIVEKCDCVSIIKKDDKIFAFSFHRFLTTKSDYFHDTPHDALTIINDSAKLLMTSEFLTVGTHYKNLFSKIHPTEIMISLCMRFMKYSIADAIIGHSREDLKTDKVSMRVGTQGIGHVYRFDIKCKIVFALKHQVHQHPILKVNDTVTELWNNRITDSNKFERTQTMNEIEVMEKEVIKLTPKIMSVEWSNPDIYANWLSQAYYIAKRSTAYLGLCLFHSDKYPEFQKRCTEHIAEETGHEKLIINDLKRLGYVLLPEMSQTSAIYKTQYFQIVENPLSFLGYVFLLELLAPEFAPYVMNQVPENAQSFLKVHCSADENHIEEAKKMFANLDEVSRQAALNNFLMALSSYSTMLDKLASRGRKLEVAV